MIISVLSFEFWDGTRCTRPYPDLANSQEISFKGCEQGCWSTSFRGLTNVRVVLVSINLSTSAAISPVLIGMDSSGKSFSIQCTVSVVPFLTRSGPVVDTRARFLVTSLLTDISGLCSSCPRLWVFMPTAERVSLRADVWCCEV